MVTMFIPGHMPLSINIEASPSFSAWSYRIPRKPLQERIKAAHELARLDYHSQERRWFLKETPFQSFLDYHLELQGVK